MLDFGFESEYSDPVEDEDAAIQAVRQARNRQQNDDLFF